MYHHRDSCWALVVPMSLYERIVLVVVGISSWTLNLPLCFLDFLRCHAQWDERRFVRRGQPILHYHYIYPFPVNASSAYSNHSFMSAALHMHGKQNKCGLSDEWPRQQNVEKLLGQAFLLRCAHGPRRPFLFLRFFGSHAKYHILSQLVIQYALHDRGSHRPQRLALG